jgi:hypothetical protein
MNITEFLAGIPVNAVLRERIARLLEDKERLIEEVKALQKDKADLVHANSQLREELAKHLMPEDSAHYQGALLKGISKGPDLVEVHCYVCRIPLSSLPDDGGFVCNRCGFIASLNRNGLSHILSKLPKP